MASSKRSFRTEDSLEAENISRNAVAPFLISRGFVVEDDQRHTFGTAVSQDVCAIDPNGKRIKINSPVGIARAQARFDTLLLSLWPHRSVSIVVPLYSC